ncbi:hypothetical protein AB0942_21750 [Streptomyces nodosus]|uniref:hypothetical protein n=1 Tax=Streptomyces nodosus TaxID=40318 RepID=UPI0034513D2D
MGPDEWHPHVHVARPEYEGLLYWLHRFVSAPLSGDSLLLRGVLPPRGDRSEPRVALWDGQDLASSVAFDISITDTEGEPFVPLTHILVLRRLAADYLNGRPGAFTGTDGFNIPVHDLRQRYRDVAGECRPTIGDALGVPLQALTAYTQDWENCALWGFVLVDQATGRYYARVPHGEGTEITVGVDLRLRDDEGRPRDQVGMLDVYLPSLAHDRDLTRFQVADGDGYCDMVCDLTEFISGLGE